MAVTLTGHARVNEFCVENIRGLVDQNMLAIYIYISRTYNYKTLANY